MGNKVGGKPSLHNFDASDPPSKTNYAYTAATLPGQQRSMNEAVGEQREQRGAAGAATSSHTRVGPTSGRNRDGRGGAGRGSGSSAGSAGSDERNREKKAAKKTSPNEKFQDPYEKFQSMFQDQVKSHLGPSKHRTFEGRADHVDPEFINAPHRRTSEPPPVTKPAGKRTKKFSLFSSRKDQQSSPGGPDVDHAAPGFFDGRYADDRLNSKKSKKAGPSPGKKDADGTGSGARQRHGEFDNPLSNIILCPGCHTPNRVPWNTKFRCYHCYAVVDPGVTKTSPDEEEALYDEVG